MVSAIKVWQSNEDKVLSLLSKKMIRRELLKVRFGDYKFSEEEIQKTISQTSSILNVSEEDAKQFVIYGKVENRAFKPSSEHIDILHKDGSVHHIEEDADLLNISVLSEPVVKHFMCFPVQ